LQHKSTRKKEKKKKIRTGKCYDDAYILKLHLSSSSGTDGSLGSLQSPAKRKREDYTSKTKNN
jgi:hypothetical protein